MAGGGSCLLLYSLPHSSSLSAAAQQLWHGQAGPAQRPPAQEAPSAGEASLTLPLMGGRRGGPGSSGPMRRRNGTGGPHRARASVTGVSRKEKPQGIRTGPARSGRFQVRVLSSLHPFPAFVLRSFLRSGSWGGKWRCGGWCGKAGSDLQIGEEVGSGSRCESRPP